MSADRDRPKGLSPDRAPIAFFCDTALTVEKARVAAQVRMSHLERQGRSDPDTEEELRLIQLLEGFLDGRLKKWVIEHPTAKWWRYGKGCEYGIKGAGGAKETKVIEDKEVEVISGAEVIGKVIGLIEAFGRFYRVGDDMIPPFVRREPVEDDNGDRWVWVEGIERLMTPSKLWKYAGLDPGARRRAGRKLGFNIQLKTMLFRLMTNFMRQRNRYFEEYTTYRDWKRAKLEAEGTRILPTPKGRYCYVCEQDLDVSASTRFCPTCGEKLGKKDEPEGVIWEGHLDFMARRRAIKLFAGHLWVVWRSALGLPVRTPYPVEYGGHSRVITPWEMCDHQPEPASAS
ncbi:MAG: hypothetical protein ABIH46_12525 [Chloroflexota bacterium]